MNGGEQAAAHMVGGSPARPPGHSSGAKMGDAVQFNARHRPRCCQDCEPAWSTVGRREARHVEEKHRWSSSRTIKEMDQES